MKLQKKTILETYNLNFDPIIDHQNGSIHDRQVQTTGEITIHEKSVEIECKLTFQDSEKRKKFENKLVNLIQEYL